RPSPISCAGWLRTATRTRRFARAFPATFFAFWNRCGQGRAARLPRRERAGRIPVDQRPRASRGQGVMKFVIQQDSSIPVHAQIKERIKTALLFGELRPGDTLPSIRDVEQELGVGRAIVRRAYLELQDCGILEIRHGRRVCISEDVQLRADASATRQLQQLVEKTLRDVRKLNVSHSSFAKLLLMRALELDRNRLSYLLVDTSKALAENIAQQISRLWEVPIHGASVSELPELFAFENHHI